MIPPDLLPQKQNMLNELQAQVEKAKVTAFSLFHQAKAKERAASETTDPKVKQQLENEAKTLDLYVKANLAEITYFLECIQAL